MSSLAGRSILILDDEDAQQEVLNEVFEFCGATVYNAPSDINAIEILKKNIIDIFLADTKMLGGDGFGLLRLISALPERPLLFLYSAASDLSEEAYKSFGVIEIFRKPFNTDRMVQSVRERIGIRIKPELEIKTGFLEKINFLVVQNEVSEIEAISKLIVPAFPNANIIGALNPKNGLQKLGKQKFDLVISELHLGKFNGINFIRAALGEESQGSELKFILVSEEKPPEGAIPANGKIVFCSKPLDPGIFVEAIRGLVIIKPIPGTHSFKIDVEFINPFIDATLKVFDETAKVKPVKDLISIRKSDQVSGDISAVIEMNSDRFLGSMAISFEEDCFLFIVSKMLGKEYEVINDDIKNAATEICNQIFTQAKRVLNEKGHAIFPAQPSLIVGKSHHVAHKPQGICIAVKFLTEKGAFSIEAILQAR